MRMKTILSLVGPLALGLFFFAFGFVLLGYGLKFISKVEELGI